MSFYAFGSNKVDSLEKLVNNRIDHNDVQSSTLHQIYDLIDDLTYNDPIKALNYGFKLEYYSKKVGSKLDIATAYNKIGFLFFNKSLYDDAFSYYMKSYDLYNSLKDSTALGYVLNDIGNIYYYQRKLDSALIKYQSAVTVFAIIRNFDGLALSYNNIGFYYNYLHEYDNAIFYFFQIDFYSVRFIR